MMEAPKQMIRMEGGMAVGGFISDFFEQVLFLFGEIEK